MNVLADKTLAMIVGPTAIGKSTLMREVVRLDSRFSYVQTFTTRPPRTDEESSYLHLSEAEAKSLKKQGKAMTWIEHPTTHFIYGTTAESFQTQYNLLDTLSGTVEMYRTLPFRTTTTVSLTAPTEQWRSQFLTRHPSESDDALKRLEEAKISIEWSLAQTENHVWLNNPKGKLQHTAQRLIDIVTQERDGDDDTNAHAILERIERGIWQ